MNHNFTATEATILHNKKKKSKSDHFEKKKQKQVNTLKCTLFVFNMSPHSFAVQQMPNKLFLESQSETL